MQLRVGSIFLLPLFIVSLAQRPDPETITNYSFSFFTGAFEVGQAPHYHKQSNSLYFVDALQQKIVKIDFSGGKTYSAQLDCGLVTAVIPVENSTDKFIVACGNRVINVTWDGKSNVDKLLWENVIQLENSTVVGQLNYTRINVAKCDRSGRLWLGTMGIEVNGRVRAGQGSLYGYKAPIRPKKRFANLTRSSGLAWSSKNDVMYFVDSANRSIYAYDYILSTGKLSNGRVAYKLDKSLLGFPEGIAVDSRDNLWVAVNGPAGVVLKVNPRSGALLGNITLPAKRLTGVEFGGTNDEALYVTSMKTYDDPDNNQQAGTVFAVRGFNIEGSPSTSFPEIK